MSIHHRTPHVYTKHMVQVHVAHQAMPCSQGLGGRLTVRSIRAAVIPASNSSTSVSTSRHEGPSVQMTAMDMVTLIKALSGVPGALVSFEKG